MPRGGNVGDQRVLLRRLFCRLGGLFLPDARDERPGTEREPKDSDHQHDPVGHRGTLFSLQKLFEHTALLDHCVFLVRDLEVVGKRFCEFRHYLQHTPHEGDGKRQEYHQVDERGTKSLAPFLHLGSSARAPPRRLCKHVCDNPSKELLHV